MSLCIPSAIGCISQLWPNQPKTEHWVCWLGVWLIYVIYTHVFGYTHDLMLTLCCCVLCVRTCWPSSSVWPSVPQWVCSQLRVTGWRNWSRLKVTLPLSQSQAGVDTHSNSAHPFISRDLRAEHTSNRMGLTVHTVIMRSGQKEAVYTVYMSLISISG